MLRKKYVSLQPIFINQPIINRMKRRNLLVALALFVAGIAMAQQMPEIPVDSAVRIGKLDNGDLLSASQQLS